MLAYPKGAHAADLPATPETLTSVFAAASGDDTIRLASGDYGTFRGGRKQAAVTLAPAPGATATVEPVLNGASNIAFDGLTIAGAEVKDSTAITFRNSRFTGLTVVDAGVPNAGIVFDHDTFNGINTCPACYEGRLTVRGYGGNTPVGVKITNSLFAGGGESDGVQIVGDAYGVQVGPGNEFATIKQGDFAAHVDPIQLYGDSHTVVTGNYFHDNSTGIMAGDGTDHAVITNNVFDTDGEYPDQIVIGGGSNDLISHNTFAGGARVRIGAVNVSPSVAETVTDNVITGGIRLTESQSASALTLDYNLLPDGKGSHDIEGRPVFSGGGAPASFSGFELAARSPGKGAASDGTDMGINLEAVPPATSPPGAPGTNDSAEPLTRSEFKDAPPSIRLLRPKAGRLGRVLSLRAVATDDVRVARVEFRLGTRRVAQPVGQPYSARRRVASRLRRGSHTVSARAVDSAGQVTTVAAAIARGRVLAGRVLSVPRADGGTDLRASGFGRRKLSVRVAGCGGGPARLVTLTRSRTHTRLGAGGLCVVSLVRR